MATTSSNLTASTTTSGGRGRDGKGGQRQLAVVLATAALGLSLLIGLAFAQSRPTAQPATSVYPTTIQSANCTDDAARCLAWNVLTLPRPAIADRFTYREDHRSDQTAVTAIRNDGPVASDRFTYREDHRPGTPTVAPAEFRGNGYTER